MKAMLRKAASPAGSAAVVVSEVPAAAKTVVEVAAPVAGAMATPTVTAPAQPVQAAAPTFTPNPAPEVKQELAKPSDVGPLSGDFDESDLRLPRLQIVQGSGELSRQFSVGTLLFMNEVLFDAAKPDAAPPVLRFIPVGLRKQFRENLEQGSEEIPRIVNTVEEVRALGGSIEWIGDEKPAWSPSGTVLLLLEKPEGVEHPGFSIEVDGKAYGPAVYYASGGAYRSLVQPIYNACQFLLRSKDNTIDISKRFWTMRVTRKVGKFTTFVPDARVTPAEVSAELKELCARFVGAATE